MVSSDGADLYSSHVLCTMSEFWVKTTTNFRNYQIFYTFFTLAALSSGLAYCLA